MPYVSTQDLKRDVLFRGSEAISGSNYDAAAVDYLNRVYQSLCTGASEFLPEYVEDWWWLRSKDVLTLLPVVTAGTITVTQNSASVVFSVPPNPSVADYYLRVETHPELFRVLTHTGGAAPATLDSPYTGPSGTLAFKLMKVTYPLSASVAAITGPMVGYRQNPKIIGLSPERMDVIWPLAELNTGTPQAFALENEQLVRFSHGGRTDGQSQRVEYRFRPVVADLTDSPSSIPLVPKQYRHILSDMALTHVYLDKNDDRSNAIALAARTGLAGMLKENRRRIPKMDSDAGAIKPRQAQVMGFGSRRGPIRTDSGLIIG